MTDKEPAGPQDEPTPADDLVDPQSSPATPNGNTDPLAEPTPAEPTGAELAASGSDTASDPLQDREPVTVGAAAASGKQGGATRLESDGTKAGESKGGKNRATRKRDGSPPATRRTGPVTFVRESVGELRKVVYPTGQQLLNYFVVVLIFVLFIIAYVSLLDLGFGWAMFQIFA